MTDRCYECGNCIQRCPVQAVNMIRDSFGCGNPVINMDKCIKCGACQKVCPSCKPVRKIFPMTAYAAISKSIEAQKSTSGGIFFELATKIIELGGIVFGAAYDKTNWYVHQIAVYKQDSLIKLQGSKYVKSDVGSSYKLAQDYLENDKWVLYSGTPCQIAGLRKYLGETSYSKLLMIDIICHGTPPVKIFQDYVKYLSRKKNGKIEDFSFRCKKYGHRHIGQYTYKRGHRNRTVPLYSSESSYFSLFLKSYILNEACYRCDFSNLERVGDITLGDFWGVKDEIPEFFAYYSLPNDTSISAVMINTDIGKEMLEKVKNNLIYYEVDYERIVKHNPRLNSQRVCAPKEYRILIGEYENRGYGGIEQYFQKISDYTKYAMRIKGYMPVRVKKILRNLLYKLSK